MRPKGPAPRRRARPPAPLAVILALAVVAAPHPAAGQAAAPAAEEARALAEAGRWPEAAAAWEAIAAAHPDDGDAWFELGTARLQAGDADGALAAFERAAPSASPPYLLPMRQAYAAAALGRLPLALEHLEAALAAGLPVGVVEGHPGLAELRGALAGDARFAELLATARRRAEPCRHDPAYRALDFWVGDWEVSAGGNVVGRDEIRKVLGDCAVVESWRDVGGGEGRSLNFRHPATGRWHQVWVAAGGSVVEYEGELDDAGALRLEGTRTAADGTVHRGRMALVPLGDGRVRQLIEESADGGVTWQVGFDAVFRPAAAAPDPAAAPAPDGGG